MPFWLPQAIQSPSHLIPGAHIAEITGITTSRNERSGDLFIHLTFTNMNDHCGTVALRFYPETAEKRWINKENSRRMEGILGVAKVPVPQTEEPSWPAVVEALKGVWFTLTVDSKAGGAPFLTNLRVLSDTRPNADGDNWWDDLGPEDAQKIRAFFADANDY